MLHPTFLPIRRRNNGFCVRPQIEEEGRGRSEKWWRVFKGTTSFPPGRGTTRRKRKKGKNLGRGTEGDVPTTLRHYIVARSGTTLGGGSKNQQDRLKKEDT